LIALDLFAGTGWGVACRALGIEEHGVELMPEARATREANGMSTLYSDVWEGLELGGPRLDRYDLLIASPPCQTFSMAGSGSGRQALDEVLQAIDDRLFAIPSALREFGEKHDPRTALVLTPLAHVFRDAPTYVVLEQVPPVLPVWERYAEVMRRWGYSVWTGNLQAEQYGVPQTRKRAILIARADGVEAAPPAPTHSRYYDRDRHRLDEGVPSWVSMADALGWGMTERPYYTIAAGTASGGVDPAFVGGSRPRSSIAAERDAGRWKLQSNYSTTAREGLSAPRGNKLPRGERHLSLPASTITGKYPRWTDGEEYIRLTDAEAAALQSYPADFVWAGDRRGPIAQQIGNAVPPKLAEAILAEVLRR